VINYYSTHLTFWTCVAGLFTLWIVFRALTVVSLVLQDAQCQIGTDQNDSRNKNLPVE